MQSIELQRNAEFHLNPKPKLGDRVALRDGGERTFEHEIAADVLAVDIDGITVEAFDVFPQVPPGLRDNRAIAAIKGHRFKLGIEYVFRIVPARF